jgi:threonine/homoserine/homoserine lactone efflux protein
MLRIAAFFYAVRKVWPMVVGIGAGLLVIVTLILMGVGVSGNMAVGSLILVLAGTGVGVLAWSVCDAAPEVDHAATQQTETGEPDSWRDQPEAVRNSPEDKPIRADRRSRLTVR